MTFCITLVNLPVILTELLIYIIFGSKHGSWQTKSWCFTFHISISLFEYVDVSSTLLFSLNDFKKNYNVNFQRIIKVRGLNFQILSKKFKLKNNKCSMKYLSYFRNEWGFTSLNTFIKNVFMGLLSYQQKLLFKLK